MRGQSEHIGLFVKSALFTIVVHGCLIAVSVASFWWPYYDEKKIKRGSVKPIQVQVVSETNADDAVHQQQQKQKDEQDETAKAAESLIQRQKEAQEKKRKEAEQKKLAEEKKRKEAEQKKKLAEEKKRKEAEQKKKLAEEKKRKEAEQKKKLAEEKKRKEAEQKKKLAEEKKRKEAEQKKKLAEEKKRKEIEQKKKLAEEKKRKEIELRRKLAQELAIQERTKTEQEARTALNAFVDKISTKVERNWRRRNLKNNRGLTATVMVKVSPTGEVISARVVKSSGNSAFDQSAETAVKRASPLPFPANSKYYQYINEFHFNFNPDDV